MAKSKKTQEETPLIEETSVIEETLLVEEIPVIEETVILQIEKPTVPSFIESGMSAKDYARIYKKRPY